MSKAIPEQVAAMRDSAAPTPNIKPVRDQALEWYFRLRRKDVAESDRLAFQAWLTEAEEHAQVYGQIDRLWQSDALAKALSQLEIDGAMPRPEMAVRPHSSRRHRVAATTRWAVAAGLLVSLAMGLQASGWLEQWQADQVTAVGEQRTLTLADGSTLKLDTDTAITLDAANPRAVKLLRGQALFAVQHDTDHPFVVQTRQGNVTVLGTRFAIRVGDPTQVDLESGKVLCETTDRRQVELVPGQHVEMALNAALSPTPSDPDQAFGWSQGRFVFQDRALETVLNELDRYRPGAIVLLRPDLASKRISGNYKLESPDLILRELARLADARIQQITPLLTLIR